MTLPFRTDADVDRAGPAVRDHLGRGGVLAYPTETVYGLGSAADERSVANLAALKGRTARKPFLLLVNGVGMLTACGLQLTPPARVLARGFWPGPLTLVLRGGEGHLPEILRGAQGGIAVRWTSHRGVARLLGHLGAPLTSTSANRPGGAPAPGAEAIVELFGDAVRDGRLMVLDGGALGNVPPSTVIDCTTSAPRLVREGAIPRAELRRLAGAMAP